MLQRRFILYFAFLLVAIAASAASFQLIQPRNVVEGRNFALTFRLTDGEANPPQAPELPGCKLLFGPSTSTMQSTEIINGRMSSTYSVDYTFTYRAEKAGEVQVPALSVNCEGKTLSSRPATFRILPPDRSQQQSGAPVNRATYMPMMYHRSRHSRFRPTTLSCASLSQSQAYMSRNPL